VDSISPCLYTASVLKPVIVGCNVNDSFMSYPSKHAEMDASIKLSRSMKWRDKKSLDLLVFRWSSDGSQLLESRPCYHCLLELIKLEDRIPKINHVFYSTKDHKIVREKFYSMIDSPKTYISSGMRIKGWYKI